MSAPTTTLLDLREQFKSDLDMREEQWITDEDIDRYINNGIKTAHQKIVRLYEDYFLDMESQELPATQGYLTYPANIYGNKVRALVYRDGPIGASGVTCEFTKVKTIGTASMMNNLYSSATTAYHRYWIPTNSPTAENIKLFPASGQSGWVDVWFIRKPATLVADTDVCPIPEFADYVLQKAKVDYLEIDQDGRYDVAKSTLLEMEAEMISSLGNQVITEDSLELDRDLSFYSESI